jgi:NO-binding membrane sensor protein with MHYT domain/putative methionine-R-sulfoxide reductase with GAF domain
MISSNMMMTGWYNYRVVALSVLIAISASYVALDLAGRVAATRAWARLSWLAGGAVVMGIGIWSMHFTGMLAFNLPVPVSYNWPTVLVSLLVVIFASAVALYVVSRQKMGAAQILPGSLIMGGGIAGMHYIGMAAMRLAAVCQFDPILVSLSVVLAIVFSFGALLLAFDLREETRGTPSRRISSAIILGVAVSVMHYTGMVSASFMRSALHPDLSRAVSISLLGTAGIATVTLIILAVAMLTSFVDRRFAAQALELLSSEERYRQLFERSLVGVYHATLEVNLQDVLANTVEAIKRSIDSVDSVSIFLVEGQEAVLRVHRGFPDWFLKRLTRIPYPKGATWKTIIEGKPIYCADVDKDTVIAPAERELGIKSYLITPIRYEGKTIGTLNINSLKKDAFDEEELKLLEIVAQQSEIAINKGKQAEALRKALLEVEQLKDRLQAENVYLQEEIRIEHNFEEIVGESASLKNVLRNVERVAPTDTTVLIQGETGTGKELIARAIHNLSPRGN